MATVIKCVIKDRDVIAVIRLLKPFALDPPVVDPMDDLSSGSNSKMSPGSLTQIVTDFVEHLAKSGTKTVTSRQLRDHCESRGAQHNSYSYPLKLLLKAGKLKKTKLPSTYEVVK